MALGNSVISNIRVSLTDISTNVHEFEKSYNTFEYVVENLSAWADETTIGAEMKDNLSRLTQAVSDTIDYTKKLVNDLHSFLDEQEMYNNG